MRGGVIYPCRWCSTAERIVVVELGAGTAISSIRYLGEQLGQSRNATLIRINARDAEVEEDGAIGIEGNALDVVEAIDEELRSQRINHRNEI